VVDTLLDGAAVGMVCLSRTSVGLIVSHGLPSPLSALAAVGTSAFYWRQWPIDVGCGRYRSNHRRPPGITLGVPEVLADPYALRDTGAQLGAVLPGGGRLAPVRSLFGPRGPWSPFAPCDSGGVPSTPGLPAPPAVLEGLWTALCHAMRSDGSCGPAARPERR